MAEYKLGVTRATRQEIVRELGVDPVADLGFPEEEPGPDTIVLVVRTPAAHTSDAHIEHCSECQHEVWVSSTTPAAPRRLCLDCFTARVEP